MPFSSSTCSNSKHFLVLCILHNCLSHQPNANSSPISLFAISSYFPSEPNYSKLNIFGCQCFLWLRLYRSNKLKPRSTPSVFLGYSLTQSPYLYLCFDPSSQRLYVSRYVIFDEQTFPFLLLSQPKSSATVTITD